MEPNEKENFPHKRQMLLQRKCALKKNELLQRIKELESYINNMDMFGSISEDEICDDEVRARPETIRNSPDEQIKSLKTMFESVEDMLTTPDFDKDLHDKLSVEFPNYMTIFQTAKRDLLKNDCEIVVAGETGAGKTTLINQLVGKKIFGTAYLATTGPIIRIRDSETMKIKCYLKDSILEREEEVTDFKKLKSIIKELTDIPTHPADMNDIYFVDVYMPVSFLKGNVIIVDTPGIGKNERLPHAVSFVFMINASIAAGIHEDRLSKILKTITDNKDKMPCFDPREVVFLTNKWDSLNNYYTSSDEDEDSEGEKENHHTRTWNFSQQKLTKEWDWFNNEKVFRISLRQVERGIDNFFTDEFKRFQIMLKETIDKNRNKRVEFYYRFLKDFIRSAAKGILTQ